MVGSRARGRWQSLRHYTKLSNVWMPTLKEAPSDAATLGHQYLIRAGLIRKSHQGGFSLLPLGLRVFDKTTKLIDEAMATVGASKVALPTMLPADMWEKSGRWESTGPEMLQLQDRHQVTILYC